MTGLLPPVNPCGYAVDMLRSCYETDVRFYRDDPRTTRIRWYFTERPMLPVPTCFGNRFWEAEQGEWIDERGEVSAAPRPWRNGHPPIQAGRMGAAHYCGTPEQWLGDISILDSHEADRLGRDPCCQPNPPMQVGLGLTIQTNSRSLLMPVLAISSRLAGTPNGQGVVAPLFSSLLSLQGQEQGAGNSAVLLPLSASLMASAAASPSLYPYLAARTGLFSSPSLPVPVSPLLSLVDGLEAAIAGRGSGAPVLASVPSVGAVPKAAGGSASLLPAVLSVACSPGGQGSLPGELQTVTGLSSAPVGRGAGTGLPGASLGLSLGGVGRGSLSPLPGLSIGLSATMTATEAGDVPGTWTKYTRTFSDFSTAATSNTLTLAALAAKVGLLQCVVNVTTKFIGGSIGSLSLNVGYSGGAGSPAASTTAYVSGLNAFNAASATPTIPAALNSKMADQENLASGFNVTITAVSSGANLSALTQGSVDVYLLTTTLP